jgi:hypothetical protein
MTTAELDAARERVDATLEQATHVDLSRVIVGRAGTDADNARRRAVEAAANAGRNGLIEEARRAAREWVLQAFAQRGYSGTWAATDYSMSVARPADRTAVAESLADAVTAAAVEDLVDDDIVGALRSRWDTLDMSSSIPEPGALNDLTRTIAETGSRPGSPRSLLAGIVLLLIGFFVLAIGVAFGLAFLIGGIVVISQALRGRA